MYNARRRVGLVARPVQQRRRQPRGHPPQHDRAQEHRSACSPRTAPTGGATRPAEGTQLANRNRKSYGSLWEEFRVLEYYWQRRAIIHDAVEQSIAFNKANVGRVVLRGSYPWPHVPAASRSAGASGHGRAAREPDHRSAAVRLLHHRGAVLGPDRRPDDAGPPRRARRRAGHAADRSHHPARPGAARADPDDVRHGRRRRRRRSCRACGCSSARTSRPTPRSYSKALLEGQTTGDTLTIGNIAPEVDEPLNWTITEAVSDCASPSDLPWLTPRADGRQRSVGRRQHERRADVLGRPGVSGPVTLTGLLCLASNDAGEPLIAIPVSLQVRSLRAELDAVRAALAARSPLGNARDDRALTAALAALARATEAANWDDGVRPDAANGRAVFDATIRAVKELQKINAPWAAEAIDTIVAIDRLITWTAIAEAAAGRRQGQGAAGAEQGRCRGQPRAGTGALPQGLGVRARGLGLDQDRNGRGRRHPPPPSHPSAA